MHKYLQIGLIAVTVLVIGGFSATYFGKKMAEDQMEYFNTLVSEKIALCCPDQKITIGEFVFNRPYKMGKAYVPCLNDSVEIYFDGSLSPSSVVTKIVIPNCQ